MKVTVSLPGLGGKSPVEPKGIGYAQLVEQLPILRIPLFRSIEIDPCNSGVGVSLAISEEGDLVADGGELGDGVGAGGGGNG